MESLDELRDEIRILADNHIDTDELERIADAIEREVEERYIERPVDADGMVIAPADNMVDQNGEQFIVSSIELLASGECLVYRKGTLGSEFANLCHHKPPTVEDVLREFGRGWHEQMNGPETFDIADYVERYAAKLQLRKED